MSKFDIKKQKMSKFAITSIINNLCVIFYFYRSIMRMTLIKITLTETDIENPTIHDVEAGLVPVLCR